MVKNLEDQLAHEKQKVRNLSNQLQSEKSKVSEQKSDLEDKEKEIDILSKLNKSIMQLLYD
jgi:multidrug resistance efflux pump